MSATPEIEFWAGLDRLATEHEVVLDRPRGSRHPRFSSIVYPLDYGYLRGTSGGDGHEIDVWVGSLLPRTLVGIVCTVDSLKADAEIKLLLGCTAEEAESVLRFHNGGGSMSALLLMREESYYRDVTPR